MWLFFSKKWTTTFVHMLTIFIILLWCMDIRKPRRVWRGYEDPHGFNEIYVNIFLRKQLGVSLAVILFLPFYLKWFNFIMQKICYIKDPLLSQFLLLFLGINICDVGDHKILIFSLKKSTIRNLKKYFNNLKFDQEIKKKLKKKIVANDSNLR